MEYETNMNMLTNQASGFLCLFLSVQPTFFR